MTKTIAFVINGDETYGISRFTASIIKEWNEIGIRCQVFSLCEGTLQSLCVQHGATVHCEGLSPPPYYGRSGLNALRSGCKLAIKSIQGAKRIVSWLRQVCPDVVVVRAPNILPMTAVAARLVGVRLYWILPNEVSDRYPFNLNKWMYDIFLFLTSTAPIANSGYTKATLLNRLVKANSLHLGIDGDFFDASKVQAASRISYGIDDRDMVGGVFARVIPEKGQLELIYALDLLGQEYQNLHLLICGGPLDGKYSHSLRDAVKQLSLKERVHFVGPQSDVRQLNLMCDFIINSRITPEPFGLSVIEGMMLGRPVLAHKAGGPAETIVDGDTGWLIDDPTSEGFAQGFRRAIADRQDWKKMGENARIHALSHFEIGITAEYLLKLFDGAFPRIKH